MCRLLTLQIGALQLGLITESAGEDAPACIRKRPAYHGGTETLSLAAALVWHAGARVAPRRAAERFEERRGKESRSAPHWRMHPRCVPGAQTAHLRSGGAD